MTTPMTITEIKQNLTSGEYSAEEMLQHAIKEIDRLSALYYTLYEATIEGGSCIMLESGRIPGFTRRRLLKMSEALFSLPAPDGVKYDGINDIPFDTAVDIAHRIHDRWFKDDPNDWQPDTNLLSVLAQITEMIENISNTQSGHCSRIKALLIDATGKLLASMIGSCTCRTNSPDITQHADTCSFRMLRETFDIINSILDELE